MQQPVFNPFKAGAGKSPVQMYGGGSPLRQRTNSHVSNEASTANIKQGNNLTGILSAEEFLP